MWPFRKKSIETVYVDMRGTNWDTSELDGDEKESTMGAYSDQGERDTEYDRVTNVYNEKRNGKEPVSEPKFDIEEYQRPATFPVGGFDEALKFLKFGKQVTRAGWNGPGQFLEMQVPDEHSKMSLPYIFINTVQGDRVPWLASQTDLLANDWQMIR